MPLDPRAKRFLDMIAAGAGTAEPRSLQARREALAKLMRFAAADAMAPDGVDGTMPGRGGDIPYRVYAPLNAGSELLPGLVFFHGGGMVAGSVATHDPICRALAQEAGCRMLSVDYRLAPEHPFPAAVQDAVDAAAWVFGHASSLGIDPVRLMVGGDSAGATLAAIVCQEAVRTGAHRPALQVLICPVLDHTGDGKSRRDFAEGHMIDAVTLAADLADYLADGENPADPLVSPLQATDLAGLPPAIIHTAEYDPLRDEGNAYAEKLKAAGVAVDAICHNGMLHNFHAMGAILPQGRAIIKQIGNQIRRAMETA